MDMKERNARTCERNGRRRRRAKIVATLGPASSDAETFRQLVRAGLDVARLNFSHGSHEQKAELIAMVRKVSAEEQQADLHPGRSARAEDSYGHAGGPQAGDAGSGQAADHYSGAD